MSPYRGRFAPSPTGRIHLGTARTALVAWLRARASGGAFVLRLEDLDRPRVVPGAAAALSADLRWLGLDWDEGPDVGGRFAPYVQSERTERYRAALMTLRDRGHVYPCTCSRKEIAEIASAPHDGAGPLYPGTCRAGPTRPERPAAFRFALDEPPRFVDVGKGPSPPGLGAGDFVVARADGGLSYQLAVVVDDAAMRITEVVRGDDLFDSTPQQLALYRALDLEAPSFLHVPLVLGPDGARLAKRHGAVSIHELRERGHEPSELVGWLAHGLGLVDAGTRATPASLVARAQDVTFSGPPLRLEPDALMTPFGSSGHE